MSSKFSKYLVYFTFIILIILLIVLIAKPNKETYASTSPTSSSTISKSMLDEMNTDVGLKDITLTYCGDTCAIGNDEKSLYECEYQDYLETDWSSCSATCGDSGVRTRSKRVLFDFGNTCGVLPPSESQPCNRFPCPVDCVVGEWESWGSCSTPCGDGLKTRRRPILVAPQYGGAECPSLEQNASCNEGPCCVTADWTSGDQGWEGTGCVQTRTRRRLISAIDPSKCPYGDLDLEERNICDISLPGGILKVDQPYTYDQVLNILGSQETVTLPLQTKLTVTLTNNQKYTIARGLPVDCVVGDWSNWSSCSGDAKKTRTRSVIQESLYGGMSCPPLSETTDCSNLVIFSYDGEITELTPNIPRFNIDTGFQRVASKFGMTADLLDIKFTGLSNQYIDFYLDVSNFDSSNFFLSSYSFLIQKYTINQNISNLNFLFSGNIMVGPNSKIKLSIYGDGYTSIKLLNPKIRLILE